MAIWLRAREKFADNRFQLLFIYIDYVYDGINESIYSKRINSNTYTLYIHTYTCMQYIQQNRWGVPH